MLVNGYEIKPGCDLVNADLTGASLRGSRLNYCYLMSADLSGANLKHCDLSDANLTGANLTGADLTGACLSSTNFEDADLAGANLKGAKLQLVRLQWAKNLPFYIIAPNDKIKWNMNVGKVKTSIGCKKKKNDFWLNDNPKLEKLCQKYQVTEEGIENHRDKIRTVLRIYELNGK